MDYEKAFNSVSREFRWNILQIEGYPTHIMNVFKEFVIIQQ